MKKGKNGKAGGVQSRMGAQFYSEVEKIKDAKLRNGSARVRVSTEKITNLIIRHKNWAEIFRHVIDSSEEEVDHYGL